MMSPGMATPRRMKAAPGEVAATVSIPAPARRAAAAASRAAPGMVAPAATTTWPRSCLCIAADGCGRRHSQGPLRKARGPTSAMTESGRPISASSTSPQNSRPGSSRWPGFSRAKVTVATARAAWPRTCPVPPSTPLGTSTARTGAAMARSTSATVLSTGRDRPAPKTASTTTSARDTATGSQPSLGPRQRAAASAAAPPGRGSARAATATGQPSCASSRAATQPSPPLSPGPHSTTTRRGRQRRRTARATARPAAAINAAVGCPATAASASARAISAGVSSSGGMGCVLRIKPGSSRRPAAPQEGSGGPGGGDSGRAAGRTVRRTIGSP
ncbi:hypothetical protein ROTAS13_04283 [Roseomonas sp. TAS13]|nr:hypothetical protein ROTAS13_04283 [Roseomonas sp. TAS13]